MATKWGSSFTSFLLFKRAKSDHLGFSSGHYFKTQILRRLAPMTFLGRRRMSNPWWMVEKKRVDLRVVVVLKEWK
jgi:hypothetical protein